MKKNRTLQRSSRVKRSKPAAARKSGKKSARGARSMKQARKSRRPALAGRSRSRAAGGPSARRNAESANESAVSLRVPALQLPEARPFVPQPTNARMLSGERLSILYVVHAFYPDSYTGTEKFVLNLARGMMQRGHRVKVATYGERLPEDAADADGIACASYEYDGIPVLAYRDVREDPAGTTDVAENPRLSAWAEAVLLREQPSLVHVAHAMRGFAFVQASIRLGIPYVMTLTDYWSVCPRLNLVRVDKQLCGGPEGGAACQTRCQIPQAGDRLQAIASLLQGARRLFSPSMFLAAYVRHVLPDLTIEALPHGMRSDTLAANARTYRRGAPLTLVYGGSLSEHKGVHVLVRTMSLARSRRLRLRIYGDGKPEYEAALRRRAAGDRRITFHGAYAESDLPRLYQEADLAVVPSVWYENYPLALHEALASHVPVIASNVGGMAEKIVDGLNGYTFRVGDARHLADRLRLLLRKPGLINGLKANIRANPLPAAEEELGAYESVYFEHAR
ncbi:Glycosyltransferase involved in cell wall bisynthesis [Paenibacillus sp. UNC496MF]|uniref:glycosyltransferase family 4 protein n=1 Tax=Paenibacillus sp. UNC496MF TaxID=1502753 RepID=UPI0008E8E166|nr:glycosyltransferase family 4 protein [Paenibacillus sp. UNC496MF]SFI50636.1 Glycosyltransferase involved in cell wall bisynthesis [Paenibacillus sp. UNC496MF]